MGFGTPYAWWTRLGAYFMSFRCLIVGAGPAGSATALALARAGLDVTLVERRPKIEQKICGECLSPPSRRLLEQWGVLGRIQPQAIRAVSRTRVIGHSGDFCSLEFGSEGPFTISRPVLDQALLDEARSAGVRVVMGSQVVSTRLGCREGYEVQTDKNQSFRADVLIGSDGRQSPLARRLGLASTGERHPLRKAAIMAHFKSPAAFGVNEIQMHLTSWGYVGINPMPNDTLNVIAVLEPAELKRRIQMAKGEGLMSVLKELVGMDPASKRAWTAFPLAWVPEKISGARCALVGDSAGFVDPFTGEGLYHALSSADRLAQLISGQSLAKMECALAEYGSWHRRTFDPEEKFCHLLQRILSFRGLSNYVIRQIRRKPQMAHLLAEAVADRVPMDQVLSFGFWSKLLMPKLGGA